MKNKWTMVIGALALITSLAVLPVTMTGCKSPPTNPDGTPDTNAVDLAIIKTAGIVKMSAQLGTYYAVRENPELKPHFEAAILLLDGFLAEGMFDPIKITEAIAKLAEAQNSPDVAIAVSAALNLYTIFAQENPSLDKSRYRPVVLSVRDGIKLGLDPFATQRTYKVAPPAKKK